MTKLAYLGLTSLCLLTGCSGSVNDVHPQSGGTLALGGATNTVNGGATSVAGSVSTATGGAISPGGSLGFGGTLPTGGSISTLTSGNGGSGVNCALVGCAAPPLCSTGCTEVCGCCPCSEGSQSGNQVCTNGCWAELGAGGRSSTGGAASDGGKPATGGTSSTGGIANTSGGSTTEAGGVCGTGCTFETTDSPFCAKGLASLGCHGGIDFQTVSAIMQANSCTTGSSDAIRFCCPPAILNQCQ